MGDIQTWGSVETLFSQEAEEAVIGAILVNPNIYRSIAMFLTVDDFFILRMRYVWEAIERLHDRGVPVDYLTITQELKDHGRLSEIGGAAYLTQLINSTPTSMHGEVYAKLVESFAIRRRLLSSSDAIRGLALNGTISIDDVLHKSAQALSEAGQPMSKSRPRTMLEINHALWDEMELRLESKITTPGIPTGFFDFDRILGGFEKNKLILLAGRPGMGKTACMIEWARRIALQINPETNDHYNIFIASMEMRAEEIGERLLRNYSRVSSQMLLSPMESDEERENVVERLVKGMGDNSNLSIVIDDNPVQSPVSILQAVRDWQFENRKKVDLVCIDYLDLLDDDAATSDDNEVIRLGKISRFFKVMANSLDIPVILLVQLNREVEKRKNKKPQMSDLRGSGKLEQDADVIIFPFYENHYKDQSLYEGWSKWIVAKHRNGPTGEADIWSNFQDMIFQGKEEMNAPGTRINGEFECPSEEFH